MIFCFSARSSRALVNSSLIKISTKHWQNGLNRNTFYRSGPKYLSQSVDRLNEHRKLTAAESLVSKFPQDVQPYLRLMRLEKPIGCFQTFTYFLFTIQSHVFFLYFRNMASLLALQLECSPCFQSWSSP